MDLQAVREKHPEYGDLSDAALLDGLYQKFYSDIPRQEFDAKIGVAAPPRPFNVLPFSEDAQGNVEFDPDAGVMGVAKRALTLPAQVARGEVDPLSGEGVERTAEAAMTVTPMGVAARAIPGGPLSGPGSYKPQRTKAPTRQELKEAADAGYAEARAMGAEYTPQSVSDWANRVASELDERGQIAKNYPKVHALLDDLKTPPDGAASVRLESLDALYRELGKLGGDPAEGAVAARIQRQLDDFHNELGAKDIVSGTADPQRAAQVLREARGNAAAGFRSDRVTGLEKTVQRRAAAANSGRNTDNAIRQRLTTLIESAKGSRGLSKDEEAFIDRIIAGTRRKNTARSIGNKLGGGGGLGQSVLALGTGAGGVSLMGPEGVALGLAPIIAGSAARGVANNMSRRELRQLDDLIRSRSPLANELAKQSPVYQPGVMQGIGETGLRAVGANSALPVYQPPPRQGPPQPKISPELLRALLADPYGA